MSFFSRALHAPGHLIQFAHRGSSRIWHTLVDTVSAGQLRKMQGGGGSSDTGMENSGVDWTIFLPQGQKPSSGGGRTITNYYTSGGSYQSLGVGPLDSSRPPRDMRAGINLGNPLLTGAATIATSAIGYGLKWWQQKAKEEEAARKKAEAARIAAAKADAAKQIRDAAKMRADQALARTIANTAARNQQTIQRMQMAQGRYATQAAAQSSAAAERAREYDLNRQDRIAREATAEKQVAAKQAADARAADQARQDKQDEVAHERAVATQALRQKIADAKAAQRARVLQFLYNQLLPKPKAPKDKVSNVYQGGGPAGIRAVVLTAPRRKKRRKKRAKRRHLTRTRKRKVA